MSFQVAAFQNRFLTDGQSRVDAILTVTADAAATTVGGELMVGFIIDKSGSMAAERMDSAKRAVVQGIEMLDEKAWFFVVAFDSMAQVVIEEMQATLANKAAAKAAVANVVAAGGTAMSSGLRAALRIFERRTNAIRQCIFLTDGKNESEASDLVRKALVSCEGVFECDCWGVGTDWKVGEVQIIAAALFGKASLVPDPAGIVAAFRQAITKASGKSLRNVRLRLWTPQGAAVVFVKQVNPTIEELTAKAKVVSAQVRDYPTGAWGPGESRDFHITIDVSVKSVGDEMLAGRPSLVYEASNGGGWTEREDKSPDARLFASWTADDSLSSRIDHHVAHYTGQDELANAIQQGLEMRETGNDSGATQMLGRAVKIAHASNNVEMTQRLSKVVEVLDAPTGTVRLKKDVKKAAEMDLQLESRTTKRVSRAKT